MLIKTVVFIVAVLDADLLDARPGVRFSIPNGNNVPHPCLKGQVWSGVGHEAAEGGGPLNPFGRDFSKEGRRWSKKLCQLDSDGDGKTNGEELGDAGCQWFGPRTPPAVTDQNRLSHPGVCEPIDSANCSSINAFLLRIPACAGLINDSLGRNDATTTAENSWCPAIRNSDVKTFEIRFRKKNIPPSDSSILCQLLEVPSDTEYHVIAWEPIIGNPDMVTRMVMTSCDSDGETLITSNLKNFGKLHLCDRNPPSCWTTTLVWSVGIERRCYDDDLGIPMGLRVNDSVQLQVHYDNPLLLRNITDSSGFRIYYTSKKRRYDVGVIIVGQTDLQIPPKIKSVSIRSLAFNGSANCSQQLLNRYNLSSIQLAMNSLGRNARMTIRKEDGQDRFSVNWVEPLSPPNMMVFQGRGGPFLQPGDDIEMQCDFDSSFRNRYTYFGPKSTDEMCFAYIEVYPKPRNPKVQNLFTFDDMGICLEGRNESIQLHSCSNPGAFVNDMASLIYSSPDWSQTYQNCRPAMAAIATDCPRACYELLQKHQLLRNPCVQGSAFRFLMTFVLQDVDYEDLYSIQSQAERCSISGPNLAPSLSETIKKSSGSESTYSLTTFLQMVVILLLLINA